MKRSLTVAALSGLLLVVTACGSDDDGVSTEQSERDTNDADDAADDPADAPSAVDDTADDADGSEDGDTPDVTTSDDAGDGDELDGITVPELPDLPDSVDGECAELYQQFTSAIAGVNVADPDLSGVAEAFESLEASVPEDLQDDVRVLADAFRQFGDVLEEYDGDYAAMMQDPEAAEKLSAMQSPEVQEAEQNMSGYFDETCPELGELGD